VPLRASQCAPAAFRRSCRRRDVPRHPFRSTLAALARQPRLDLRACSTGRERRRRRRDCRARACGFAGAPRRGPEPREDESLEERVRAGLGAPDPQERLLATACGSGRRQAGEPRTRDADPGGASRRDSARSHSPSRESPYAETRPEAEACAEAEAGSEARSDASANPGAHTTTHTGSDAGSDTSPDTGPDTSAHPCSDTRAGSGARSGPDTRAHSGSARSAAIGPGRGARPDAAGLGPRRPEPRSHRPAGTR
jgi:hypothetical protein